VRNEVQRELSVVKKGKVDTTGRTFSFAIEKVGEGREES